MNGSHEGGAATGTAHRAIITIWLNPMEDWQKEFWQQMDIAGEQIGEFLVEVAQEVTEVANAVGLLSEEVVGQWRDTTMMIENSVTEWLIPAIDALLGVGEHLEETTHPLRQTVEPWRQQHPVCTGCQHYHGQVYGGQLLVCGMHPYGMAAGVESCPDREETRWLPPNLNAAGLFFHPHEDEEW